MLGGIETLIFCSKLKGCTDKLVTWKSFKLLMETFMTESKNVKDQLERLQTLPCDDQLDDQMEVLEKELDELLDKKKKNKRFFGSSVAESSGLKTVTRIQSFP